MTRENCIAPMAMVVPLAPRAADLVSRKTNTFAEHGLEVQAKLFEVNLKNPGAR